MKSINSGLIGFGMAGKVFHAPFVHYLPGFNLSKISTSNPDSIRYANEKYPEATVVPDADQVIQDPDIELIFVLTPNETHFPLVKKALLAGKHVVVDKPFTVTVPEADELIALAKQCGKLLAVYHNRRLVSDYKTVKKILESGCLGRVVEYMACYDRYVPYLRPKKWKEEDREGSGVLYDLGSHLIDQVLQLFGMPLEVTANLQRQRDDTRIVDYFMLSLQYDSLNVYLHSGMLLKSPGPNFAIHGTKGSFVKYGQDVQEADLIAHRPLSDPSWGKEPDELQGLLTLEEEGKTVSRSVESEIGNYADFFTNLYQSILGKATLIVQPEEARDVIVVIEAAKQSVREKRTIPLIFS